MAKGLYANIPAKRKRGEKMRKPGASGAPTEKAFKDAAKTALKKGGVAKKLSPQQEEALSRHKKHHTDKHMSKMRRDMRKGSTFTQAHKAAMKEVGK